MLLKTWYIYYPNEVLNTIWNELGLLDYEKKLLNPEDHKKIHKFLNNIKEERRKRVIKQVTPEPMRQPNMS